MITLNKTEINSTTKISSLENPAYLSESTNNFLFAIGIQGMDLSVTQNYFSITLDNKIKSKTGTSKTVSIPLATCNISTWSKLDPDLSKSFESINFTQFLCPAANNQI